MTFNHFSELPGAGQPVLVAFNVEQTDNASLDVHSNPDGTVTPTAPPQPVADRNPIPEWGQSLGKRVKTLEQDVTDIKKEVQKIGQLEQKVDQGFAEINARLDKMSGG